MASKIERADGRWGVGVGCLGPQAECARGTGCTAHISDDERLRQPRRHSRSFKPFYTCMKCCKRGTPYTASSHAIHERFHLRDGRVVDVLIIDYPYILHSL